MSKNKISNRKINLIGNPRDVLLGKTWEWEQSTTKLMGENFK